jgi:hypothetical protein
MVGKLKVWPLIWAVGSLKISANTAQGFKTRTVTSRYLTCCLFSLEAFNIRYGYNLILHIAVPQQFVSKVYCMQGGIWCILRASRTTQTYRMELTLWGHTNVLHGFICTELDQADSENGVVFRQDFWICGFSNSRNFFSVEYHRIQSSSSQWRKEFLLVVSLRCLSHLTVRFFESVRLGEESDATHGELGLSEINFASQKRCIGILLKVEYPRTRAYGFHHASPWWILRLKYLSVKFWPKDDFLFYYLLKLQMGC